MIAAWAQSVAVFMGWFVLAAVWGTLCYGALVLTRGTAESVFVTLGVLTVVFCIVFTICFGLLVFLPLAPLCLLPASLEWRMGTQDKWAECFVKVMLAAFTSLWTGIALVCIANATVVYIPIHRMEPWMGLLAGFTLTPPAISILRWMWRTSKLRPGYDRALREGEVVPEER